MQDADSGNSPVEQKLRELAVARASLRHLAVLIAQGEAPETVFAAVTEEALRLLRDGTAAMVRFDSREVTTLLAHAGVGSSRIRVGERLEGLHPAGMIMAVRGTGQPVRIDDTHDVPGAVLYLREGVRSGVAAPIRLEGRLWGAIAVGAGQGRLPLDAEERMAEFADLVAAGVANARDRRAELLASRARLVAASDQVRRRIERDLHDGAQQRLVVLAYRLRMTAESCPEGAVRTEIGNVAAELLSVLEDLQDLCRGIHPAVLSRGGLRPALRMLARRSAVPVTVDVQVGGRLPEPIEVAAYYVVSEMLTNVAKHAHASTVEVDAVVSGQALRVCVHDDGVGGADPARGSGLTGLRDRIEALGGTFTLHSTAGEGTTALCELPVPADRRRWMH
ncbi:GAF domain-containing sensor histidine kinase [Streptomyces aquilus]|uniref:GAF domain-containing sensor histidine kinase n=1 Tax=Streptomyces aquilus TaxID=2548456 RepID=UPI0036AD9EAE